jgi:hypothetical protein
MSGKRWTIICWSSAILILAEWTVQHIIIQRFQDLCCDGCKVNYSKILHERSSHERSFLLERSNFQWPIPTSLFSVSHERSSRRPGQRQGFNGFELPHERSAAAPPAWRPPGRCSQRWRLMTKIIKSNALCMSGHSSAYSAPEWAASGVTRMNSHSLVAHTAR